MGYTEVLCDESHFCKYCIYGVTKPNLFALVFAGVFNGLPRSKELRRNLFGNQRERTGDCGDGFVDDGGAVDGSGGRRATIEQFARA